MNEFQLIVYLVNGNGTPSDGKAWWENSVHGSRGITRVDLKSCPFLIGFTHFELTRYPRMHRGVGR